MKYSYIKWTKLGSDFMFFFLDYSPNMLLSGSRDKTLIIWNLTRDEQAYGYPKRSLEGHSHIVSDCVCIPNPSEDRGYRGGLGAKGSSADMWILRIQ